MKKSLVILIAFVLLVSLVFSGCKPNVDEPTDAKPTESTEVDGNKGETEVSEPKKGEIVTITALCNAGNTMTVVPDEMPSFQRWYEETGIKIEWEFVRTDWGARKNLVLASDDIPDTFWGNRTINLDDLANNADIFVPLNDYIEKSVNIKQMFEEEPSLKQLATFPDGNIYSLPYRMPLRPDSFQGNYINKTWLDALGLEVPTTLDEFENVLRAFRDNDPNGNGLKDEIAWSWAGTGTAFGVWWFFGSYGMANNVFDRFAMIDGEPVFIPVTENYKEGIKHLARLYKEGLVDPEVFTQDWSMWQSKCQQTDPTIMGLAGMWTINTLMGNQNGENYVTMPPLKGGPYGDPIYPANYVSLRSGPVSWTMTTSCENPDAAFKFIDHVYAPEESVQLYFGSYGVGTKIEGDGTISLVPPTDPDITYDNHIWTNSFGDMGPYYVSKSFEKNINLNEWVLEKKNIDEVYQPFLPKDVFPPMIFSNDDNAELATLKTDIGNIVDNKMAAWITGEADIDAEWDAYLKDLNSVGLERYMEINLNRYNEYTK